MQLAEAHTVCTVDHESVHRGHIDPGLDNRGAYEYVVLTLPKIVDDLLKRTFVHLPMGNCYARFGYEIADLGSLVFDIGDPIVHIKHLAFAQQFATNCLGNGSVVVLPHVGEDRLTIGRRRIEQREVTDSGQRHFEGTRNRGRGEREHVHVLLHVLDRLLMRHPKALFLIHHE